VVRGREDECLPLYERPPRRLEHAS
jgi:hypothetical protein